MLQSHQEEYRRFFRVFQGAADKRFLRTPCIAAALHSDNRYPLDRQRTSDPGKHHTNLKPRGWHAGKQGTKNRMQMAVTARHEHFTPPAFQASPMFRARVSPRIMRAAVMASVPSPGVMEERGTGVRHPHPIPPSLTHQRINCLPEKDAPHHVHPATTSTGTTGTRDRDLPCVPVPHHCARQCSEWDRPGKVQPEASPDGGTGFR